MRQQSSDIRQEPEPARARLDPRLRGIPEAVEPPFEGRSDFGRVGYAGPCPPVGHPPHEYVFASSPWGCRRTPRPGRGWTTCGSSLPRS